MHLGTGLKTLAILLIITLFETSVLPQGKSPGEIKPLGKSIPGLDIIIRRKPPKDSQRFSVGEKGNFDLGVLPAGRYELSVVRKDTSNARVFYESPCKPCYGVALEGTAKGKIKGLVQYRESDSTMRTTVPVWLGFETDGRQRVVGVVREENSVPRT